jgi:transcriptional regulator ATRX
VTKQSLSQRVIDEHQLDRHFTSNELRELYAFEPDNGESEIPNMPSDELLKNLLLDCKKWIVRYHDHESLLENKIDEGLTEEDRKAAWEEYENERTNPFNANAFNLQMAQMANEQRNVKFTFFIK